MSKFKEIKELVSDMEKNADQFYDKRVKAAGTRFRGQLQTLKILANEARAEVLEITKSGKEAK